MPEFRNANYGDLITIHMDDSKNDNPMIAKGMLVRFGLEIDSSFNTRKYVVIKDLIDKQECYYYIGDDPENENPLFARIIKLHK
jgi:hypothetical protein